MQLLVFFKLVLVSAALEEAKHTSKLLTEVKAKEVAEVNSKGRLTRKHHESLVNELQVARDPMAFFQEESVQGRGPEMRVVKETGEAKLSDASTDELDEMEAEVDSEEDPSGDSFTLKDDFTLPRQETEGPRRSDAVSPSIMRRQDTRELDTMAVKKWFGLDIHSGKESHWWRKIILVFAFLGVALLFMCMAMLKADNMIKRFLPNAGSSAEGSELQEPAEPAKAKEHMKSLASLVEGSLGQCAVRKPKDKDKDKDESDPSFALRSRIEALPVSAASQVETLLPSAGGYDVSFSKPMSSRWLLRLEAVIQDPSGDPLLSPLTRRPCVLYTAHALRKVHGGMPLPLAFASQHIDFTVTLRNAPQVAIRVAGAEVNLFSTKECELAEVLPFPCAPDHWQDFVSAHLSGGGDHALENELRAKGTAVEFHECCLTTGATVTLVGELLRSASGELTLQPLSQEQVSWRTSWEKAGLADDVELLEARAHVLISDDPSLLSTPSLETEH